VNCLLSWQGYAPAGPTILRSRSLNPMELPPGIWPPQYVFTAWRRNKSWGGHCLFGSPARTLPAKSNQSRYAISEDALDMKTLPDHLRKGMKLVIVGCNPTESSVRTGHYYSGRGNPFWPVLFETGVIPEPLEYRDDKRIIEFAIGLTDLVKRPTRTIEELTREDYAEGRIVLSQKLGEYVPHVIAFNGRSVYEQFAQRRAKLGLQKEPLYGAKVYVLPATDSQHVQNPKDRLLHFRKLAALIRKVETSRDAKPL